METSPVRGVQGVLHSLKDCLRDGNRPGDRAAHHSAPRRPGVGGRQAQPGRDFLFYGGRIIRAFPQMGVLLAAPGDFTLSSFGNRSFPLPLGRNFYNALTPGFESNVRSSGEGLGPGGSGFRPNIFMKQNSFSRVMAASFVAGFSLLSGEIFVASADVFTIDPTQSSLHPFPASFLKAPSHRREREV